MLPPDPFNLPLTSPGLKIAIFSELDGRTTELLFSEFPIRVGRNRQNDLVLRHEYVSQFHAEVHMQGGQLSIMQVGSSNSVRVDGDKLHPREHRALTGREEIRVVPFSMRMELMVAPVAIPASAPARASTWAGWIRRFSPSLSARRSKTKAPPRSSRTRRAAGSESSRGNPGTRSCPTSSSIR